MKTKILALIAALAITTTAFASCGSGTSSSTAEGTDSSTTTGDAPKEEVSLMWYQLGDAPADSNIVYEKLNEMSKKDLNTVIDFKFANDEKAKLIVSTNEYYDIIFSCSWHNDFFAQREKGMYADLKPALETVAKDLYDFIPTAMWDVMTRDGKILGIPTYKDSAWTSLYNMPISIYDAAGITDEDWAGLNEHTDSSLPILLKIQKYIESKGGILEETGTTTPLVFTKAGWGSRDVTETFGAGFVLPTEATDTTIVHTTEYDKEIRHVEFMKKCQELNLINKDANTAEAPPEGVFTTGHGWVGCEPFWKSNAFGDKIIKVKDGPLFTSGSVAGSVQAISLNSKYVDRAVEYLQYCNLNADYRNMFAYGLEGEHYTLTDEGTVLKTDKGTNSYAPGSFSQATFFTLKEVSPTPPGSWDALKKANENAQPSQLIGFVPSYANIESEIAAYTSTMAKYDAGFALGTMPDVDAYYAKVKAELQTIGLEKIRTDIQSQIDAFVAAK